MNQVTNRHSTHTFDCLIASLAPRCRRAYTDLVVKDLVFKVVSVVVVTIVVAPSSTSGRGHD
jgi:hypothetical protein